MRSNRAALGTLATTGAVLLANLIAGVVLARELGPSGRGTLAAFVAWSAIAVEIALVGTQQATVFFIAGASPAQRTLIWRRVARCALIQGVAAAVLFALFAQLLPVDRAVLLAVGSTFVARALFATLLRHRRAYLQGTREFGHFNSVRIVSEAGPVVGILAAALLGVLTIETASLAYLGPVVIAFVLGVVLVDRKLSRQRFTERSESDSFDSRSYRTYSWRSFLSIAATYGNSRVDLLGVSVIGISAASVGHYAVALTAAQTLSVIGVSVGMIAFPRIAAEARRSEQLRVTWRAVRITAIWSTCAGVLIAVFANPLIETIFGSAFAESAQLTQILVIGGIAVSVSHVAGDALRGLNRVGLEAIAQAIGLFVTILGIAMWTTHESLMIVATASSIGFALTLTVQLLAIIWIGPRPPNQRDPSTEVALLYDSPEEAQ